MKNFEIIPRKISRQLLKYVALVACLGFAGFSLPLAHGQQESLQKSTSATQVTPVRITFKPVKVSETELKNVTSALPATSTVSSKTLPGALPLEVTSPANRDLWEAGKEYLIRWNGAKGEVRIDLVSALSTGGTPLAQYSIVDRAPNTGIYRFKVPNKWVMNPHGYKVRVNTLDGKQSGSSQGAISVYTQPVDLECEIVDVALAWSTTTYIFYTESSRWFEFNVLMRNKGTMNPVTIENVLVRIIKEPENVVVAQEEWGFSGIYGHEWYRLPEPRKFDIESWKMYYIVKDKNVNLKSGSYRVEVELDPQNRLGENQQTRDNNKCVKKWIIK